MRYFLLCCLLSLSLGAGAATTLRQSFDLQVSEPPTAVISEGSRQLVYELHVTNYANVALLPTRLDVLDADSTKPPLASWEGGTLLARSAIVGSGKSPDARQGIAPGMHAVIYIEIAMLADTALPRQLTHRLAYEAITTSGRERGQVLGGTTALAQRASASVGPPLRGGPWVAIYGASFARGHRRVLFALDGQVRIPARFAIDWIRLNAKGEHARGDEHVVANWLGLGEEVLAVADASVVATRGDYPQSRTLDNPAHSLSEASGNFVSLDLGDGRYAHYEHLEPGSVRVHPGDHVRRGQVIGALGFSGDSTGPHLHFHVSDGASPLAGEGQPFVVDRYDVIGNYTSLEEFAAGKPWQPLPLGTARLRNGTMPAPSAVADFPQ
ncbi:MAG: M23 family metallopeptidase [Dokdonella sp.]